MKRGTPGSSTASLRRRSRSAATCRCSRAGRRFPLDSAVARDTEALGRAVEAILPQARLAREDDELAVFAGPDAEVTLRRCGGGYALDLDRADDGLAERIGAAVAGALVNPEDGPS